MSPISLEHLLYLTVGGVLIWTFIRLGVSQAVFVVRVVDGEAKASEGTVMPAFLTEVREVAAAHGVSRGTVRGVAQGSIIRLAFSREFPPSARQQIRNWWASYGWPAPRLASKNLGR